MSESLPLGVAIIPVTPFQQNCSLVWCTETMQGALIDPGGEIDRLLQVVARRGVALEKILVTHAHLDHAGAVADLAAQLGLPVEGPERQDQFWIDRIEESGRNYGMPWCKSFRPDRWLEDGDKVTVGKVGFDVRHCPGHTPGHVVFFQPETKIAFVGDVLFAGSIGRTDFPMGDYDTLIRSITGKLWPLGDDVTFVPGHGPTSTFGAEKESNPYVGWRALA